MQKFKKGYRVKIADEMPPSMFHFTKGVEAIIDYSYNEMYHNKDFENEYSLILLDKNSNPVNSSAWYPSELLTLVSDDVLKGLEITEKWNNR